MSTLQRAAARQASGKSVIKLQLKTKKWHEIGHPIKSTTQNAHQTSARWRNRANKIWKQWRRRSFRSNGEPRSPLSCKPLIVVSSVLQVSVCWASGDGWVRLRRRRETPLMSHFTYSTQALSPSTAAPLRLMDDLGPQQNLPTHPRPNTAYCYSLFKCFSCLCPVFSILSFNSLCSFHFLFYLCDLSWKMLLCCSDETRILQSSKWSVREGEPDGGWGLFFFLTGPTSI